MTTPAQPADGVEALIAKLPTLATMDAVDDDQRSGTRPCPINNLNLNDVRLLVRTLAAPSPQQPAEPQQDTTPTPDARVRELVEKWRWRVAEMDAMPANPHKETRAAMLAACADELAAALAAMDQETE